MGERAREFEEQVRREYESLLKMPFIQAKPESVELINKAFAVAREAHEGVVRKSGEPYILHPIAVAQIVSKMLPGDAESIACALLHDVVEDTDYTVEDMKRLFNPSMANIIDGLTKIGSMAAEGESQQAANFQKTLLTIEDDFRTIFIKLADRLHNMRTLDSMPKHKQHKIASETTYFYAPIAERVGLYNVKTELEDLSFRYRDPQAYEEIKDKFSLNWEQLNNRINSFALPIIDRLTRNGVQYSVEGRPKSIYSIWKKMQKKHISFEEVYDLLAMRIIFTPIPDVPEKTQCWFIYTIITEIYPVLRDRTRDWVSTPKVNGYEALHCTLLGKHGDWVEVQIRTDRMNEVAEHGLAAHWKYKGENALYSSEVLDNLRASIVKMQSTPYQSATDFLSRIRTNILAPQITVFDTEQVAFNLERGSTVLDFAYAKSPSIGNKALGARVNGVLFNLNYALRGGDVIEIITAQSQLPSPKWLDYVQSPLAKNCINQALSDQARLQIDGGKRRVAQIFEDLGADFSATQLQAVLPHFSVQTAKELYAGLATGVINPDILRKQLRKQRIKRSVRYSVRLLKHRFLRRIGEGRYVEEGQDQPAQIAQSGQVAPHYVYVQSPCCTALPGDDVVGFLRDEQTVVVHKATCTESVRLMAQRAELLVNVSWHEQKDVLYEAHLYVSGEDRKRLLADLFNSLADQLPANITHVNLQSDGETFSGVVSQSVHSLTELERMIQHVNTITGVRRVYRLDSMLSASKI